MLCSIGCCGISVKERIDNRTSHGDSMDGVSQVSGLSDQLRLVASKGQVKQVEDCLRAGATLNVDQDGRTALHYAALNGFMDVTKFLVEKGCDINIQDDSGYTALHRAASQGHVEVIRVLLESGCDLNTQDEHGNAAIHESAWNGFSKTLELLVKHEVNINVTNKAGFTALHLAAQNGHNESSRVLLYAGCNSDSKNNYGDTALHTAARYGHAGVTRILISARAKLNEQNKNGDTALHISAALKRRKIAKLLVESGTDVSIRNKQNENSMDVARRKDHHEIINIIQAFNRVNDNKIPRMPMREVNFKEDMLHEIDGPVVVPDRDLPEKHDTKPDKGKKFFFFKKKKTKEKDKNGGVTQQKTVPGCKVHVNKTPVQGFFSKYVPREGVQYYRDLAGNVKKGPVGYTPQCNCLPAMYKLEKEVNDTKDYVYGHISSTHQAMQERMDQLDQRASLRVQSLEKYTRDRFTEEEQMCHQRIDHRLHEHDNHYGTQNNQMKMQIQDWLEEKLEGYGHCLHHHHDDSVLPNENIFSDVHETANGRLFKSRSDETLSQSDNHSGKFRKRDFYESRAAAMQQMRAWQVPTYSKDRSKVQVHSGPPVNTRSQSKQQLSTEQQRQYPVEPRVEVRNSNRHLNQQYTNPPKREDKKVHDKLQDNTDYVTMHGAVPKQTGGMRKSQSYQPTQRSGTRGPVTHSTPKSGATNNNYETIGMVHSHTDSVLSKPVQSDSYNQLNVNSDRDSNFKPKLPNRPNMNVNQGSSRQLMFNSNDQERNTPVSSSSPQKSIPSASVSNSNSRNSMSSDKFLNDSLPKPTFTTFGYDGDDSEGRLAPANSPNQKGDRSNPSSESAPSSSTPRSNSDLNFSNSPSRPGQYSRPNEHCDSVRPTGLTESQGSFGFVPAPSDDNYVDMSHSARSQRLHQRARSADGLLDDDSGFRNRDRLNPYTSASQYGLDPVRSSSVPRTGMGPSVTNSPNSKSTPQPQVRSEPNSYSRNNYSMYSVNTSALQASYNQPPSFLGPPTSPRSKAISPSYNPYSSNRDILNNNARYSPNASQNSGNLIGAKDNVYGTVRDVKMATDNNHNVTVKTDVHTPNTYYSHSMVNNRSGNRTSEPNSQMGRMEPRSQTAYQTYLTEDLQVQSGNMFQRENSPNTCNNSKEDSSSNPDSGYSSKIYGNRANSATPASTSSTPSSSFSTDRGISLPSNNNSPQSQYSNGDYDSLPKHQYYDQVQTHMQSWYQRKIQETTQKVFDNWKSDQSPAKTTQQSGRYRIPVNNYGSDSYGKIPYDYSQAPRSNQPVYGDYNGQSMSHIAMHGSDV